MKITIEGEAKEIAELVMQIQTRHEFDDISGCLDRLFIYDLLKSIGVLPTIERTA